MNASDADEVDVIEWRIDHVPADATLHEVAAATQALVEKFSNKRLLVTLCSATEGGEYPNIHSRVASRLSGHLVDIEYSRSTSAEAISAAQANEVVVVGSYHDFKKGAFGCAQFSRTPPTTSVKRSAPG